MAAALVLALAAVLSLVVTRVEKQGDDDVVAQADVDSEALAAFETFGLVAPRRPPNGLQLTRASVIDGRGRDAACPTVELRWEDPDGIAAADASSAPEPVYPPDLTITLASPRCATGATEDSDPFKAGRHRGTIARQTAGAGQPYAAARLIIGDVSVLVESDLPENELMRVIADLTPVDSAELVAGSACCS